MFSEDCILEELTLMFSYITATAEGSFASLKRISIYLRVTQGQVDIDQLNTSRLSIERNILLDMEKCLAETFHENVTLEFTQGSGQWSSG